MRRVYGVWFLRSVLPVFTLEIGAFVVSLSIIKNLVFVERVIANALTSSFGNPFKIITYGISAFFGTSVSIQLISLVLIAGTIFFIRDIYRSAVSYALLKHVSRV